MVKIPAEAKEEITYTEYLPEGIHEVKVVSITSEVNANDKEYFEFTVENEDGAVGTARLYMSEKAMKWSVNTIRGIFVHNTVEKNKDAIRDKVNSCETTEELFEMSQSLIGKQCWYSRFPNGQTYRTQAGELRNSFDTNISHFEPKAPAPKSREAQVDELLGGEVVDASDGPF